jgi:hypothetical protein
MVCLAIDGGRRFFVTADGVRVGVLGEDQCKHIGAWPGRLYKLSLSSLVADNSHGSGWHVSGLQCHAPYPLSRLLPDTWSRIVAQHLGRTGQAVTLAALQAGAERPSSASVASAPQPVGGAAAAATEVAVPMEAHDDEAAVQYQDGVVVTVPVLVRLDFFEAIARPAPVVAATAVAGDPVAVGASVAERVPRPSRVDQDMGQD